MEFGGAETVVKFLFYPCNSLAGGGAARFLTLTTVKEKINPFKLGSVVLN